MIQALFALIVKFLIFGIKKPKHVNNVLMDKFIIKLSLNVSLAQLMPLLSLMVFAMDAPTILFSIQIILSAYNAQMAKFIIHRIEHAFVRTLILPNAQLVLDIICKRINVNVH